MAHAVLFTFGAALLALALPVVIMHAVEAAERRASLDALLLIAAFALAATVLRSLLLAVRDRILLQAALWFDHTAGAIVLADRLDRGVVPDNLEADRAALDQCVRTLSGPAMASLLDAIAAAVPLTLLFLIHPALGAVSLLCVTSLIASALVRARASGAANRKASATRAAADKAWRTAAANGPMIAARRMSDGVVADWETLNRAAIVASYGIARPTRKMAAILRAVDVTSCVLIAVAGVCLVQSDGLSLAGLAAAIVLHVMLTRPVLSVHDRVPDLAALEAGLHHLAATPSAMMGRAVPSAPPAPSVLPAHPDSSQHERTFPVSLQPHPSRPIFDNQTQVSTARARAVPSAIALFHGGA